MGKGITFDTGGISIKPAQGMEAMKADMTGAASVIAAMQAVAALAPKADILAIAPCTENMPGGNATRPGDVVSAMNGKTIEILNTDAEGRLVLADGLCYARELGARHLVDVATLTGAISVALGDQCYGLMTNDDALATRFEAAAEAAGERSWRLPMFKEYGEQLKSNVSVVKNIGGRPAGSITAASSSNTSSTRSRGAPRHRGRGHGLEGQGLDREGRERAGRTRTGEPRPRLRGRVGADNGRPLPPQHRLRRLVGD